MIDILTSSAEVLSAAGFETGLFAVSERHAIFFEDATVVGFLFVYQDPSDLARLWDGDANSAITKYQFSLRRAGQKAWNTYIVLLTAGAGDYTHLAALSAIEEDLSGTRKIARMSVRDLSDLHAALLPLLPLQASPSLEAIDMRAEIRQRTSELPHRGVDAFLSATDESVVIQVLEEAQ